MSDQKTADSIMVTEIKDCFSSGGRPGYISYRFKVVPSARANGDVNGVITGLTGNIGGNTGDLMDNQVKFIGYSDLQSNDKYYAEFSGHGRLVVGASDRPSPVQKSEVLWGILSEELLNNHGIRNVDVEYTTSGGRVFQTQDLYSGGGKMDDDAHVVTLTHKEDQAYSMLMGFYIEHGFTNEQAEKHAVERLAEVYPRLKDEFKGKYKIVSEPHDASLYLFASGGATAKLKWFDRHSMLSYEYFLKPGDKEHNSYKETIGKIGIVGYINESLQFYLDEHNSLRSPKGDKFWLIGAEDRLQLHVGFTFPVKLGAEPDIIALGTIKNKRVDTIKIIRDKFSTGGPIAQKDIKAGNIFQNPHGTKFTIHKVYPARYYGTAIESTASGSKEMCKDTMESIVSFLNDERAVLLDEKYPAPHIEIVSLRLPKERHKPGEGVYDTITDPHTIEKELYGKRVWNGSEWFKDDTGKEHSFTDLIDTYVRIKGLNKEKAYFVQPEHMYEEGGNLNFDLFEKGGNPAESGAQQGNNRTPLGNILKAFFDGEETICGNRYELHERGNDTIILQFNDGTVLEFGAYKAAGSSPLTFSVVAYAPQNQGAGVAQQVYEKISPALEKIANSKNYSIKPKSKTHKKLADGGPLTIETRWLNEARTHLLGKKVKAVGFLTKKEAGLLGWSGGEYEACLVVEFTDGSIIYASGDGGDNEPGFFGLTSNENEDVYEDKMKLMPGCTLTHIFFFEKKDAESMGWSCYPFIFCLEKEKNGHKIEVDITVQSDPAGNNGGFVLGKLADGKVFRLPAIPV